MRSSPYSREPGHPDEAFLLTLSGGYRHISYRTLPTCSPKQATGCSALHYAANHGATVECSRKPRKSPLRIDVPFDSEQRGPKLAVFDIERDEPGAIKEVALGIDDLPNRYTVHDLYEAWSWMFEKSDRPD